MARPSLDPTWDSRTGPVVGLVDPAVGPARRTVGGRIDRPWDADLHGEIRCGRSVERGIVIAPLALYNPAERDDGAHRRCAASPTPTGWAAARTIASWKGQPYMNGSAPSRGTRVSYPTGSIRMPCPRGTPAFRPTASRAPRSHAHPHAVVARDQLSERERMGPWSGTSEVACSSP